MCRCCSVVRKWDRNPSEHVAIVEKLPTNSHKTADSDSCRVKVRRIAAMMV
jgi:hypothetical protein